jgi:hypothetical protein
MSVLKQQPELYKKKIWPLDLSKQYAEDVKDIAFEKRYRIVDSTKITASFKEHYEEMFKKGLCAGFVEKDKLPKVTVVPPRHSKGKTESKEDLLLRALSGMEAQAKQIEELKAQLADKK